MPVAGKRGAGASTHSGRRRDYRDRAGGEPPGGETNGGEPPRGETNGGETNGGETNGGEVPRGEVPRGEVPRGEVPRGEVPRGEMPRGEMHRGEMPRGEVLTSRILGPDGTRPGPASRLEMTNPSNRYRSAWAREGRRHCFLARSFRSIREFGIGRRHGRPGGGNIIARHMRERHLET
jgi:hypothetical protein